MSGEDGSRKERTMIGHKIGTRQEWAAAREELLAREKEHTRLGDELARERRELPWVPVERKYRFDTDEGEKALVELFDGRSQLLVYHFMFGPSYEAGCTTCSSIADGINALLPHLHARDVTMLFVSIGGSVTFTNNRADTNFGGNHISGNSIAHNLFCKLNQPPP